MASIIFYFKIHQPVRIRHYTVFDRASSDEYFDEARNRFYLERIVRKSYRPTLALMQDLVKRTAGRFKVNFGVSGTLIEQLRVHFPDILEQFRELARSGSAEFTGENYYHALSSIAAPAEFAAQVRKHRDMIAEEFRQEPRVFANTEFLYFNDLPRLVAPLGFRGILTEGVDWVLGWRSPNYLYRPAGERTALFLRNYKLSDDMSFRFSSREWAEYPLTADKFARWLSAAPGDVINLFMDFETFGEHQWESTGIFKFLEALPFEVARYPHLNFLTLSEALERYAPRGEFAVPRPVTWADTERDLTAWLGNDMQQRAFHDVMELERHVATDAERETWRRLQTADHFYYMCTKWFNDGDVHKYFNPYASPYEAFLNYMNIVSDFRDRIKQRAAAR